MDKLLVRGGNEISGSLRVSGSKNTALTLMAAALMADGEVTISNVPSLKDVSTFSQVMQVTGASVSYDKGSSTLKIDPTGINNLEAPYELVKKMRASIYMLGALLGKFGKAKVSLPGGCAWGPRPVDLHIKGMEALGAKIKVEHGYIIAEAPGGRLKGGDFSFNPSSVGATVNVMLAASMAEGISVLRNVAIEPDVVVFGEMLKAMGAEIEGLGTRTVEIHGVENLSAIETDNCPDRIELGTFMVVAAIAGKKGVEFEITGAEPEHLGSAFLHAFEQTGVGLRIESDKIWIRPVEKITPVSIKTDVYPGFPTDLQAQWTILLSQAEGESSVTDTIYRDRFKHIPELTRLGMNAKVEESKVRVWGPSRLTGAEVMSTDLRASVSLVLAGMIAEGETSVLRVYHLDRGYERLEEKLTKVGVDIERVRYSEFGDQPAPHII